MVQLKRAAVNAPTIALSGVRSLAHDPVMFGMQVARRFAGLRSVLDDLTGRGESRAATLLHLWSAGEQDALTEQLQRDAASVEGLGVVGAEIATAAGHPDLVVDDVRLRPIARARAAWMLGDVETAFAMVPYQVSVREDAGGRASNDDARHASVSRRR